MDNATDDAQLLRRLLCILTPGQLAMLIDHLEQLAQYSHGKATITRVDGHWHLIAHEVSDKA